MSDKIDYKELASQLRCPSGERAKEVGENMFASNWNMIENTIAAIPFFAGINILEIGFGNGQHLPYLFDKECFCNYAGVDISEEMCAQAAKNNAAKIAEQKINLQKVDESGNLPFADHFFNHCITVNTLYFWKNPIDNFSEIYRVLQPESGFTLTFVEKEFSSKLPFTQHGFTFYEPAEIRALLEIVGFKDISVDLLKEEAITKDGQKVNRPFWIMNAKK